MKILHNQTTTGHNVDSDIEGPYRTKDFVETVSNEEINNLKHETEHYLSLIHSPRYIQKVKGACKSKGYLAEVSLNPDSFTSMMTSLSLAIMAAKNNNFAITRPPGHHASREKFDGFCFFNNIAVAISFLLQQKEARVCIIDIDGHHGNGTQSIFCNEDRVMFTSIHQKDVYPMSGQSTDIGKGPSFKKVINIPIPKGSGDDIFLKSLEFIIKRIRIFDPDHIAISSGFDGYFKDKTLDLMYSKRGYYEASKLISTLGKPTFSVLEGGYHDEVKSCVEAFNDGMSNKMFNDKIELNLSSPEHLKELDKTLNVISQLLDK